ncbi:MAG: protein kinase [candidate division Zixibacteria bacterium]|nr:protein kinase [candidate division Zixibacteria bacterium]
MFEVGHKFAHFEILSKIGEGGMGEVYLAKDLKLNRQVAIKVLHPESFDEKERKDRFIREAQTAAQINHPNVMGIFDIGTAEKDGKEFCYIVSEYISGRRLTDIIKTSDHDLKELVRIAERIAAGLAAAHRLNIVHRDIKADNIMIEEGGEPKILDFGLAKAVQGMFFDKDGETTKTLSQELTKAGKILGTVSYMSPEQARGEKVDIRSDIFSFGILLYRMVTGEFPFEGPTQVSTLAKILESNPEPPSARNENIPPELERIIDKCLRKDAADRYQGASDLVVDLRGVRRQYDSGVTESVSSISVMDKKFAKVKGIKFFPKLANRKLIIEAVAGVAVVVAFLTLSDMFSAAESGNTVAPIENSLAIIGFENKTGDESYDWLTTGLPEILLTDLSQMSSLNIISRERIFDCFPDKNAPHSHEACIKAAQSLGASKLLTGSFYRLGEDKIRIDARLEDVATGNIILAEKVVGTDAFSLVDSLTMKLAASLGIADIEGKQTVSMYTTSSEEAFKYYIAGVQKFVGHNYDDARQLFNKALAIDSTFAMPYLRIGMSYVFQGRPQQGKEFFRKAIKYQDKMTQRDRNLLDVYADLWLNQEFDDAFTKLEVFVKNFPNDKEGRAVYGILIFQFQKDTVRALAQVDTALQLDPLFLLAHSFNMLIYGNSGYYDEAIKTGKLVKKISPDSPLPYEGLARVYKKTGQFDKAIIEYKELSEKFPSEYLALRDISRLFIIKRQFDSAYYYLQKYRASSKDDPYDLRRYHRSIANLNIWQGKLHKATKHILHAIEHSTKTSDSVIVHSDYIMLAQHQYRNGNSDSAIVYADSGRLWATAFNKIAYPLQLLQFDYSRRDEAREIFKSEWSGFRAKMPSDFLALLDAFGDIFEASYNADTAAMLAGSQLIGELQDNDATSQNRWSQGVMHIQFREYEAGRKILQEFVDAQDQSHVAYVYLLAKYYLGVANQALGNSNEAVENFTEMLTYWTDPDIETKEIIDAQKRLAELTS